MWLVGYARPLVETSGYKRIDVFMVCLAYLLFPLRSGLLTQRHPPGQPGIGE
jgi:hypothetical protein